jgi:arylamine N-acetyltransferase
MAFGSECRLEPHLVERVLERLHVEWIAVPSLGMLRRIYAAWCERIPFDNIQKLIHVSSLAESPLPGGDANEYFESWLKHGTGGTCWAGSEALRALLLTLGFHAERALGTMLVAPDLPPNHGSVRVWIDGNDYLLDTSILHHEPLQLVENRTTEISNPAWRVRCYQREGFWHLWWRPLHTPAGIECRFDGFGTSAADFYHYYEATRGWSPFNYQVCARRVRGDEVIGLAFGKRIILRADGSVTATQVDDAERTRTLREDFGLSEEIIAALPADRPTPPPPGSRTAAASITG